MGSALLERYMRHKEFDNVEKAIRVHDEACTSMPEGPNKAEYLINLGFPFLGRFGLLKDTADLDRTTSLFEEALCITPEELPAIKKIRMLFPLHFMLKVRFEMLGHTSDIDRAIFLCRQLVALYPDGLYMK
jgi:hypothetical protein